MKTPIAAILGATVIAGTALISVPANATCTQVLYAERSATSAGSTQLLGRVSSTATILWIGTAVDNEIQNAVATAVSQRNRVSVTGNLTSCPTAGSVRSVGTILSLIISP